MFSGVRYTQVHILSLSCPPDVLSFIYSPTKSDPVPSHPSTIESPPPKESSTTFTRFYLTSLPPPINTYITTIGISTPYVRFWGSPSKLTVTSDACDTKVRPLTPPMIYYRPVSSYMSYLYDLFPSYRTRLVLPQSSVPCLTVR